MRQTNSGVGSVLFFTCHYNPRDETISAIPGSGGSGHRSFPVLPASSTTFISASTRLAIGRATQRLRWPSPPAPLGCRSPSTRRGRRPRMREPAYEGKATVIEGATWGKWNAARGAGFLKVQEAGPVVCLRVGGCQFTVFAITTRRMSRCPINCLSSFAGTAVRYNPWWGPQMRASRICAFPAGIVSRTAVPAELKQLIGPTLTRLVVMAKPVNWASPTRNTYWPAS